MEVFVLVEGCDRFLLTLWEDVTLETLRAAVQEQVKLAKTQILEGPNGAIEEDSDIRSLCVGDTIRVVDASTYPPLPVYDEGFEYRAFMFAVFYDRRDEIRTHLDSGINPGGNNDYDTVMCATRRGNTAALAMLLKAGASPSRCGEVAPLCVASGQRDMTAVHLLIAHGADVTEFSKDELSKRKDKMTTALETSLKHEAYAIADVLIRKGADMSKVSKKVISEYHQKGRGTVTALEASEGCAAGCTIC